MQLSLNNNHIEIIQDICDIQMESLGNVASIIDSPEKEVLYKELELPKDFIIDSWKERCNSFLELQENPHGIIHLDDLNLTIVSIILLQFQDNWKYRYPVAFKSLKDTLVLLLMEKSIILGTSNN